MGLPNIAGLTKVATKSITCILLNQKLLLNIAAQQCYDAELASKIKTRMDITDKEVASLKIF